MCLSYKNCKTQAEKQNILCMTRDFSVRKLNQKTSLCVDTALCPYIIDVTNRNPVQPMLTVDYDKNCTLFFWRCMYIALSDIEYQIIMFCRCNQLQYAAKLPSASVIIIFHNEAWSSLLRTVHSVVNRSPPEHLQEVVLLDDFSDRSQWTKFNYVKRLKTTFFAKLIFNDFVFCIAEELGNLGIYVNQTWPDGIVRLVRTPERSGLIRARLAGARAASGDVIIFLDSHCECNVGWYVQLLVVNCTQI